MSIPSSSPLSAVYQQMVKKLESHKTLTGRKKVAKANLKIAALQVELAHVDGDIEKLVNSLTGAYNVPLSYVNVKIAELDGRKQELVKRFPVRWYISCRTRYSFCYPAVWCSGDIDGLPG